MANNRKKKLMMISFDKASELYLSTLATEGKSLRYIDWLKTRLRYFGDYLTRTYGKNFTLQDLNVEDGRSYLRELMQRGTRYEDHPMHKAQRGKLKVQYIHGLGRAVHSFSSWAYDEGYLEENVMRRLKLPKLPKTLPEPLTEDEIQRVLTVSLDQTYERLRNFSIMMLFFDTGIRLDELVNLRLSRVDFAIGEMTITGKGNKERKVPIGLQAKKALLDYISLERPEQVNLRDDDCVFLSSEGFPITHTTVEKLFQRVKQRAEIDKFHPHACRHTFGRSFGRLVTAS